MSKAPAPDENEHVLGKILGSCTAQLNGYSANPDKFYFAAPYKVLDQLTVLMKEHYGAYKATRQTAERRNRDYMKFYVWTQSDEFKQAMGNKYQFSEPYLVGSAWSPMIRDDSVCDVVMSVYQGSTLFNQVPKEAMDTFVLAFSKKFLPLKDEGLFVRNNTIIMSTTSFALSIRLSPIVHPPFAARLTSAMNQYEDFLPGFNSMCFAIHTWCKNIRKNSNPPATQAVPSSHTLNLLIVHFLQYYEEIPHFFINPAVPNSSYLVGYSLHDIIKFKMPAYHQTLLINHRELQEKRKGCKPGIGELLIMFFYHYGYLADLVNYDVSLATNDFNVRGDYEYLGLSVSDTEDFHGTEVPDAFKFQYLCREAFHVIKNAQNPHETLERLLRMEMNVSFSTIRNKLMMSDVITKFHMERAFNNMIPISPEVTHQTALPNVDRFSLTQYGDVVHWIAEENLEAEEQEEPEQPFTEEKHALKGYLKGLKAITEHTFAMPPTTEKSRRMFMRTVLPNPRDLGELIVLFRPPLMNNLHVIEDALLEPSEPLDDMNEPWFLQQGPTSISFVSLIQQACRLEQTAVEYAKRMRNTFNVRYKDVSEKKRNEFLAQMAAKRKAKKPARVDRPVEPESEFAKMFMERAKELGKQSLEYWKQCDEANAKGEKRPLPKARQNMEFQYEPHLKSGMVSCKKMKEMYETLRKSWLAELDAIVQPNTEYSGFDYC